MATLEKLRVSVLRRGVHGIRMLGRTFRVIDDSCNRRLSRDEFVKGARDFGITTEDLNETELIELFDDLDLDCSGDISFDEFLMALRPAMSHLRVELVKKAFMKLDRNEDGNITVEDINALYDVSKHPKYMSGEFTKMQVLKEFLDQFHVDNNETVTLEEFLNYYSGVSASIDRDVYFDFMMRQAWKL